MPRTGICVQCKESGRVLVNRHDNKPYCRKCRDFNNYHDKKGWQNCSVCKKYARVSTTRDVGPICHGCYREYYAPRNPCDNCKKVRPLLSMYKGKKLCTTCRSKVRMADSSSFEICIGCGMSRPVATRNIEGIAVCYNCYRIRVEFDK